MKKFIAIVMTGFVIAILLASFLPATPVVAKVGTLALIDIRYNPRKGYVVIFAVKDGVLGQRNLHATMKIGGTTYDLSCMYQREMALVVCANTQKISGDPVEALITIYGQNYAVILPKIAPEKNTTSPATCMSGFETGYVATIQGTSEGTPHEVTSRISQTELNTVYGGNLDAWIENLRGYYQDELGWLDVSISTESTCVPIPL